MLETRPPGMVGALTSAQVSAKFWTPAFRGKCVRVGALATAFAMLIGVLLSAVRCWYSNWGASQAEVRAYFPGDELSPNGRRGTRAISIRASAAQVFAWVSQLGQNRGGFYSYELLEDLAGCEMPNVVQLDPSLQHWVPGEKLWMYPPRKLRGMGYATLLEYQPGRSMVFGTHTLLDAPHAAPSGTWSFFVQSTGERSSRLIVRGSGSPTPNLLGVAFNRGVFEPLHFAMERRMMEGIRGLAEGRPISRLRDALVLSLWGVTFGIFFAAAVLVVIGARWRGRLVAFVSAGVLFQILTLAQPSPLLGIPLVLVLLLFTWTPQLWSGPKARKLLAQFS